MKTPKTLQEYLQPNPNVPAPWTTPRLWIPPRKGRGSRSIGFRSKGSARAVLPVNGFTEGAESGLELDSGLWMLAQFDITDIISQSPQVNYTGTDGKLHRFTFDFTSIHTDGSRTAHSVKPANKVASSGIEEIHRLLQRQMSPKLANRINLVTEEKLAPQDRFNAEVIYTARRRPVPEHDAVIEGLIADLHGTTTVEALCRSSGLHGFAYRAVVRLIAGRKLRLVEHARILPKTAVCRPQAH
jgi:hypothetical protein